MQPESPATRRTPPDWPFMTAMLGITAAYVGLILFLLIADALYATDGLTRLDTLKNAARSPDIRASVYVTLITCTATAILSVIVAAPTGYLLSRYRFTGKNLLDAVLDIPIVLPPLVIGLSLLIFFNRFPIAGKSVEEWCRFLFAWLTLINPNITPGITYKMPAVILAQFTVSCAFAVRTMRITFDQISPRHEQVALTLGCSRSQAFWTVVLPEAWRGVFTAGTLAWARAMGEFGPILVFAGTIRGRTEVLSTTVFLDISIGNLEGAVAVALIMVGLALIVLMTLRMAGIDDTGSLFAPHSATPAQWDRLAAGSFAAAAAGSGFFFVALAFGHTMGPALEKTGVNLAILAALPALVLGIVAVRQKSARRGHGLAWMGLAYTLLVGAILLRQLF